MENLEKNLGRASAAPEKVASPTSKGSETYGDFASTLGDSVITEDLASFFIVSIVIVANVDKVSSVKSYFPKNSDFESVVEHVLHRMEKANCIRIDGDNIQILTNFLDLESNPKQLLNYLPSLFRVMSGRVLLNELKSPELRKARMEMVRFFALPDHPEVAAEVRALDLEYKAKLVALQEKALKKKFTSNYVRVIGIVDSVLDPEDFS